MAGFPEGGSAAGAQ